MKASYSIYADRGHVVTTFEGSVTLPEMGAYIQTVWSDPRWKPDFNGILDFSAATIDMSDQEIQELSKGMTMDPRCSLGRWAFVVTTAANFAKLRKIDPVAELKSTMRIFFDRRSAEEWLISKQPASGKPEGKP
jgi:hypothetical protein